MEKAKVFLNGGSQAVRLPKDCRFDDDEVLVNKIGGMVILMPKSNPWATMSEGLEMFSDDYLKEIPEDFSIQERDSL